MLSLGDEQKDREQRLAVYLSELRDAGDIDAYTAALAGGVWQDIRMAAPNVVRVPNASANDQGAVLFTWNEGEHHLELEVFPDGKAELFYRNRTTSELWDYEYKIGEPIR